jgi:hypothetical protein
MDFIDKKISGNASKIGSSLLREKIVDLKKQL